MVGKQYNDRTITNNYHLAGLQSYLARTKPLLMNVVQWDCSHKLQRLDDD